MASTIKRSAIPASGYSYQTLAGIQVLCDWLDDPNLFEWVKFEADDLKSAQGLDDIVLQRRDGRLELKQVKFTVDPFDDANALSLAWLTNRNGKKGKSLLEKWSAATFSLDLNRVADLRLITNRRPDAEFASWLLGNKLELAALPAATRAQIEAHVGGAQRAEDFFDRFLFDHSFFGLASLERTIVAALEERHTDHAGWLALFRASVDWSIHKNCPAPDGRITLDLVRSTISQRRPRPLDQEFRVPNGYLPPDADFADDFIDELQRGSRGTRVLWGSPGQGKSTFLSYACKRLKEGGSPVIRHHYFLDLQDASDRFNPGRVADSLMVQMRSLGIDGLDHLGDHPEDLRQWFSACGKAYEAESKRFIIIVDGLDHVWRENDEEIGPLKSLFDQLLPLPANTSLIIGTQRVDHKHLPARLNAHLQPEYWVELPRMRLPSIHAWVLAQHDAGIFQIESESLPADQISKLAAAFERCSEGHPLVLTYTFLALIRQSQVLTAGQVDEGAPVPMADSRAYYASLWQRLSPKAKDALHLMAVDDFIWPVGALEQCLGSDETSLESEIGHLVTSVDAGLVAFHGSLYVFISNQSNRDERVWSLLSKVQHWLETDAPPYLRWAWLWVYQSRQGSHDALLANTSRSWAVEGLASAYPSWQLIRILEIAEEVAFAAGDYEQAIRKRALKTRLHNGLSYQLDDVDRLEACALRVTADPYPSLLLASELNQSSVHGLHRLALLYLSLGQKSRASEVQERLRLKINDQIESGVLQPDGYQKAIEQFLEVAAGTHRYEPGHIVNLLLKHHRASQLFERFLNGASQGEDVDALISFSAVPMPVRLRRVLELETIRTASWTGAQLHRWEEFSRFRKHSLSVCWHLLYQGAKGAPRRPYAPAHEALATSYKTADEEGFSLYLHHLFFDALARTLTLGGAKDPDGLGVHSNRAWMNAALDDLAAIAHACGTRLSRGEAPVFSIAYRCFNVEAPKAYEHNAWFDYRAVRRSLVMITADLYFLSRPRSHIECVSAAEWNKCKDSSFFALEHWRELFLERDFRILDAEAARLDIEDRGRNSLSSVQPFNELATELAGLCTWATAYGLDDLAVQLLSKAYRCAIGYGWRKDWKLPMILESVEEIAEHDTKAAVQAIMELAPIYTHIGNMTEKSGANPSDLAPILLRLVPDAYVRFYNFLIESAEWYEAERAFAMCLEVVDLAEPETGPIFAFLGTKEAQAAVRTRKQNDASMLLDLWTNGTHAGHPLEPSGQDAYGEAPPDHSAMPSIAAYPPNMLNDFIDVVEASGQSKLESECLTNWFHHWEAQGRGAETLKAIDSLLQQGRLGWRRTQLLDLAYPLSRKTQGPAKAFRWLVEAHRYRQGWSGIFHGQSEAARRIKLVAKDYPKRWAEFVDMSTVPIPEHSDRGRAIPDTGLITLLLHVGEVPRAISILRVLLDIAAEEFEMQPLGQPSWLMGHP